jgi:hypothetical protein
MGQKRKRPDKGRKRERPEQHETESRAKKIFEAALAEDLVHRAQVPDYHVDYAVELFARGNPSGRQIAVQLKGTRQLKLTADGSHISFRMKTDDLKYYVRRPDPIFLVVVDVPRSKCHYLFLQRFIREQLAKGWRQQKSNVVHVPLANDLVKLRQFKQAAIEAQSYLTADRLPAALAAQKRKYERIDPRIQVAIKATTEGIGYQLNAREAFDFSIVLKGDPEKVAAQMRDLIERGIPLAIKATDLDFEGAPLLKHLVEQAARERFGGQIRLHASREFRASVVIQAVDSNDSLKVQIDMGAKGEGGTAEIRIHAELPDAPLAMLFKWFILDGSFTPAPTFSSKFLLSRWCGKPIRYLPHFDPLLSLLEAISDGCDMVINCIWEGNRLFAGRVANAVLKGKCDQVLAYLRLYAKAREIAAFLNADPKMPFDLTVDDLRAFEDLHWRLLERTITPGSMTIGLGVLRDKFDQFVHDADQGKLAPAVLKFEDEIATFLGKSYSVGPAEYTITNTKIHETGEELRALAASTDGPVPAHLEATPQTEVTAKRLSKEPPKELPT